MEICFSQIGQVLDPPGSGPKPVEPLLGGDPEASVLVSRETEDLAPSRPLDALWLRQALLEQMALDAALLHGEKARSPAPMDPELREELRDLGYLGRD